MATAAIVTAALGHAALSFALWDQGHAPSSTWLPSDWHYLVQALVAGPLYLTLWHILSYVVSKVIRIDKHFAHPTCGWVLGTCTLGLLVVPDAILYLQGGVEALRRGAPFVLALLFFGTWFWLAIRLKKLIPNTRWRTTVAASLLGLVAQALVGAIILR